MRKIKIFSGDNFNLIQENVNKWLADHKGIIIHDVLQTESYNEIEWSLTITIFYYEGEQGDGGA